jgi:transcriptional regulator
MYVQQHFEEHRKSKLHELIRAHPLATLVTSQNDEIVINHMPFVLNSHEGEYGLLMGHMPLSNPAWKILDGRTNAVAVFQGAAKYISPNWYPSKKEHGKTVPTWNYAVVHVHGCPRVFDDPDRLMGHLSQLTDEQESDQSSPWKVSDAPREYTLRMIKPSVRSSRNYYT